MTSGVCKLRVLALAILLMTFVGGVVGLRGALGPMQKLSHPRSVNPVINRWWSSGTKLFSTIPTTGSAALTKADPNCRSMVICGPSGAGKGTIIGQLLSKYPESLSLSVSHTTRAPRPGEIEGVHYHFVAREKMAADIASQEGNMRPRKFLEYAEVHKNLYGTSLKAVQNIWTKGKLAILDVDIEGVKQIRDSKSVSAKYIWVAPPDMEQLQLRLIGRGTENPDQIAVRMRNAQTQMQFAQGNKKIWDLVLVNDNLDSCVDTLVGYMSAWFPTYVK